MVNDSLALTGRAKVQQTIGQTGRRFAMHRCGHLKTGQLVRIAHPGQGSGIASHMAVGGQHTSAGASASRPFKLKIAALFAQTVRVAEQCDELSEKLRRLQNLYAGGLLAA